MHKGFYLTTRLRARCERKERLEFAIAIQRETSVVRARNARRCGEIVGYAKKRIANETGCEGERCLTVEPR